jgi:hypothetical protein
VSAERVPCLCGCGRRIRRSRSLPLCKAASDRAWAAFRTQTRGLSTTEYQRRFNAFYGSAETVAAALAGV